MIPAALYPVFPWLAGFLGLIFGSFYTVCVHRYLKGQSIVRPGSHCPKCLNPLRWWENLPVLSFVILAGRCGHCRAPIPWRYPALELLSALWAVLLAWRFGPGLAWLLLMAVGGVYLVAAFIDLEIFILPDALTYPGAVLGLAAGVLALHQPVLDCLIGALVGAGLFWLLRLAYFKAKGVEGLGLGDVKLMLMIGAMSGWLGLPVTILLGALSALVISPVYMLASGQGTKARIPFGPFLCLGSMISILWGPYFLRLLAGL